MQTGSCEREVGLDGDPAAQIRSPYMELPTLLSALAETPWNPGEVRAVQGHGGRGSVPVTESWRVACSSCALAVFELRKI